MAVSSDSHVTRAVRAFAFGPDAWVVFCSCGRLTGFADSAAGADDVAARHAASGVPVDDREAAVAAFGGNFRHGLAGATFDGAVGAGGAR